MAGWDKMWPLEHSCHWNVFTKDSNWPSLAQSKYYLKLKRAEAKFRTKTSDYVIKMRQKRQDEDVPDQKQPHPYQLNKSTNLHDIVWHPPILLGLILSFLCCLILRLKILQMQSSLRHWTSPTDLTTSGFRTKPRWQCQHLPSSFDHQSHQSESNQGQVWWGIHTNKN